MTTDTTACLAALRATLAGATMACPNCKGLEVPDAG